MITKKLIEMIRGKVVFINAAREIINFAEGKPIVYPVDLTRIDKIA